MPYLFDGHNIIGKIPEIHLDDPEDERQLVHLLSKFLSRVAKTGTVYFDRRSPGGKRKYRLGRLQVEFMTSPNTADQAIQTKLRRLRGEARNYTVVTSDREIETTAKAMGAKVIQSQVFVQQLEDQPSTIDREEKPEYSLSIEDVELWEKIFRNSNED
jgi:predicted RNA-binding protein with PIN domain